MTVIGTSLQHSSGDYLNLKSRFSFTHLDFLFEDPQDSFSTLSKHKSRTFQAGLQNDFQISSADALTIGYEFEGQQIDERLVPNNDAGSVDRCIAREVFEDKSRVE